MKDTNIAIFSYAFPHRKTNEFLCEIISAGYKNIIVLAAPWRKLTNKVLDINHEKLLHELEPLETIKLCKNLGISYFELEHENVDAIKNIVQKEDVHLGIIAGARILRQEVIDCFSMGVINFHPGKLPQTSGLDSLYYTIKLEAPLGVTAHFIDAKVDAGAEILFQETLVGIKDSIETLAHNNRVSQLVALRKVLHKLSKNDLKSIKINRIRKNSPMESNEKIRTLSSIEIWKINQYLRQTKERLIIACQNGDDDELNRILSAHPEMLECQTINGWTPLIVAAFHHQSNIIKTLIKKGANVNATGMNGTTVLMYAKTKFLHTSDCDYSLLKELIDAGADIGRYDKSGKSILDYVAIAGDEKLAKWLGKIKSQHKSLE